MMNGNYVVGCSSDGRKESDRRTRDSKYYRIPVLKCNRIFVSRLRNPPPPAFVCVDVLRMCSAKKRARRSNVHCVNTYAVFELGGLQVLCAALRFIVLRY